MARSVWKGPFVDGYLLKKRNCSGIRPQRCYQNMVEAFYYNAPICRFDVWRTQRTKIRTSLITEHMVGHKFGSLRLLEPILVTRQIKSPSLILEHIDMSKTSAGRRVGSGCTFCAQESSCKSAET